MNWYNNAGMYLYSEGWKRETDVTTAQLVIGADLRLRLTESFSVFGGAMVGIGYINVKSEFTEVDASGSTTDKEDEDDFGFVYGGTIGAELSINEHHSLMATVSYLASTAELKECEKQSYTVFSVGYKYTF